MKGCCDEKNPCEEGQGDCKSDDQCAGDLFCGKDNCGAAFTWDGADCCTRNTGKFRNAINQVMAIKYLLYFISFQIS